MKLSICSGDKPLWRQLYEIIQKRIEDGIYASDQTIPSEKEFIEEFGISRTTVRQAMDKLVSDGVICRKRGKGTVVKSTSVDLSTVLITQMATCQEVNNLLNRKIESIEYVDVPLKLARLFDVSEDSKIIRINRFSTVDDEIVAFYETYLNPHFIPEVENEFSSLYKMIQEHLGKPIDSFTEEVLAGATTFEEQKYFQIAVGVPILIRKRTGYVEGNIVEYTICRYRGDRYKMVVKVQ
ncbi:MAG: GntR family transcriptional regulator [Candidatus Ornithospirochaeta sp.]|nr:GntR family transcriptional regulator [Sphaerochaetaceae bacterium]MDY5523299.1 GntR family transcriptional regulator [Candidatus Ornithospirochaeta sp.]